MSPSIPEREAHRGNQESLRLPSLTIPYFHAFRRAFLKRASVLDKKDQAPFDMDKELFEGVVPCRCLAANQRGARDAWQNEGAEEARPTETVH